MADSNQDSRSRHLVPILVLTIFASPDGDDMTGSVPGDAPTLGNVLQKLDDGGLREKTRSWVGTGENQPVSGAEVAQALSTETLDGVAQRAGLTSQEAADQLASVLPETVNKLTPEGTIPEGPLADLLGRQ